MEIRINLRGIWLLLFLAICMSCEKDETKSGKIEPYPGLNIDSPYNIARTSAYFTGSTMLADLDTVTEVGFCWGTNPLPTLADRYRETYYQDANENLRHYENSLLPDMKYHARVYVITEKDTLYGDTVSFNTKSSVISTNFNEDLSYDSISDIDGNIYKTIQIGAQEWMAENLKTTHLNDGSSILLVEEDESWGSINTPAYCWLKDDEHVFKNMYGGYYNWYAVSTDLLCPAGWHVPTEEDWKEMKMALGMSEEHANLEFGLYETSIGDLLKEAETYNWVKESILATNESGFTAIPGGVTSEGPYGIVWEGIDACWWSATPYHTNNAWCHGVVSYESGMYRSSMYVKSYGLNVRCVKDK